MLKSVERTFLVVIVASLVSMLAVSCGGADEPAAPTPVSAEDIRSIVGEAVAASQTSKADIESIVSDAVAAAQTSSADIQKMVSDAVTASAQPGVTAADVEAAVKAATAGQLSAREVQSIVDNAVRALPVPEIDTNQIQGLVESAVKENVPEGTSAAEIQRMVEAAVSAVTSDVATRGDLEDLVAASIKEAAADQLTADDVTGIVNASLVATEKAVEEALTATKALEGALMATEKAVEGAAMAAEKAQLAAQDAASKAAVQTERKKKVLTIGTARQAQNLNPVDGQEIKWNLWLGYSQLIYADPVAQEWRGGWTKSYEIDSDGHYTFHLNPGMKWSDGAPITTQDVKLSFEAWLSGDGGSTWSVPMLVGAAEYKAGEAEDVAGIKVLDDLTIKFEQVFPNVLFAAVTGDIIMFPHHVLGDVPIAEWKAHPFWKDPELTVSAGAYKLHSFVEGQFVKMVANDMYHLGRPTIDEVNIVILSGAAETAQIAFERGDLDILDGYSQTALLESAIADHRANVIGEPGSAMEIWTINTNEELGIPRDPRFRQAWAMALDRQAIIDTFYGGNGSIKNSVLGHGWYQKSSWHEMYPYDPAGARKLLEEMDYDFDRVIECDVPPYGGNQEKRAGIAAEQAMLAEVGIKLKLSEAAWGVVAPRFNGGESPCIRLRAGMGSDPDTPMRAWFETISANPVNYASAELDARILEGRQETDTANRRDIYQKINEEYFLVDLPFLPVLHSNLYTIVSKRFYAPGISDMRPATSLTDVQIFPTLSRTGDQFRVTTHLWDLLDE